MRYGCADSRSQFSFVSWPTNNGSFNEQVHQDTGFIESTNQNTATGNLATMQWVPGGWSFVTHDSSNGNIYSMVPGQTQDQVLGPSATSHMIQTPTGWSIDVPMTTVAINSGAINTTGPVTVGGTGHSIATGTASNTDLAGELAFSAATTATYNWTGTYISHPEVNITAQMDIGSGNRCWVSYTGVTSFTINCASAVTGAITYGPIGRN